MEAKCHGHEDRGGRDAGTIDSAEDGACYTVKKYHSKPLPREGTLMNEAGPMTTFLVHEFQFLGVRLQNWMIVFAVMVLLFLLHFRMTRQNSH
jgi:hypothetical protein